MAALQKHIKNNQKHYISINVKKSLRLQKMAKMSFLMHSGFLNNIEDYTITNRLYFKLIKNAPMAFKND